MLREIDPKYIVKEKRDKNFRWFSDESHDLFLWYNDEKEIIRFQFCYDKNSLEEQAVEWIKSRKLFHQKVDDGESAKIRKSTPIFISNGLWSPEYAKEQFDQSSLEIEEDIRHFIDACFLNHTN